MLLSSRTPWIQHQRYQIKVIYLLQNTVSLVQPLDLGSQGPLRHITHSKYSKERMDCQPYGSEPWWREYHGSLEGWHNWQCHECYLKKAMKAIKPETIDSCWRDASQCCTWPYRICKSTSQGNHDINCGCGIKGGRWRVSRHGSWRNLRAKSHYTEGTSWRQLDGDECFWISARQWGRQRQCQKIKLTLDNIAERFWLFKILFVFL